MDMQDSVDMAAVIKMLAHDGARTFAAWGYVANFDPDTYTVQVTLATYQDSDTTKAVTTPWIPLGTPYAGDSYGLEVYPEQGTPCLVVVVDADSGSSVSAVLMHNAAVPPVGGLQLGEFQLVSKGGSKLKLRQDGKLEINGGTVPVAVEGSKVDISQLVIAINQACVGVLGFVSIPVPPDPLAPTASIATGQGAQDVLAPAAGTGG